MRAEISKAAAGKRTSGIGRRRTAKLEEGSKAYHQRREEIIAAAVRVFNRLGYQGASLSAVANDLGIDRATLYYYFASKEQMFDEIVRSVLEENHALARRIAESEISPRRKLRELITAMMISYAVNYPLLYIYIREDLANVSDRRSEWSVNMRKINRGIEQTVIEIIEQGYADESFRRIGSSRTVAYAILGMLNWTHRWFRPDRSEPPEEIGKSMAELALAGLETPY